MGIRCTYVETVYASEQTGYTVAVYRTNDDTVPEQARDPYPYHDDLIRFTATGRRLPETAAIEVDLEGEWVNNEKYGRQLDVTAWEEFVPPTVEGVCAYLSSGLIKGIGPQLAAAIVGRFGVDSLYILERDPRRLLEISGITEAKLETIYASYMDSRVISRLMVYLAPFGVTKTTARKIYEAFGSNSISVIRTEPFQLCRIPGFGFKKVDEIARKSSCPPGDPVRIRGALFYTINALMEKYGHLFVPPKDLIPAALKLLNERLPAGQAHVTPGKVKAELDGMLALRDLVADSGVLYMPGVFRDEDYVASAVAQILVQPPQRIDVTPTLSAVKRELGIPSSEKQDAAVKMALTHPLSIITGPPGSGKTTIVRLIIQTYRMLGDGVIVLAALTGKASRRLAESIGLTGADDEDGGETPGACTLHRALGLITSDDEEAYINSDATVDADLFIVDEFSMADMWLTAEFFRRVGPHTRIVLIGDAAQLPSVGPGEVFRQMIDSGVVPVTVLDEIFRQEAGSRIAENGKRINAQDARLEYGEDFVLEVCASQKQAALITQKLYRQCVDEVGLENVQILSPFKSNGDASAAQLCAVIREQVNPPRDGLPEIRHGKMTFRVGDRILQTKNKNGMYNGDSGLLRSIKPGEDGAVKVAFEFYGKPVEYDIEDLEFIEHGYAATVHKAMGSEYDTVILVVLDEHRILLDRHMFYTAVTRGKRKVILVGQESAIVRAIRKKSKPRNTLLQPRIVAYYEHFKRLADERYVPRQETLPHTG